MNNKIFALLFIFGFILDSCTSKEPQKEIKDSKTTVVRLNIREIEEFPDSEIYDSKIQYIIPDTIGMLGHIKKIVPVGDLLFIKTGFEKYPWDNSKSSVVIMSFSGQFINKIKAPGKGPGEYIDLSDFLVDANNKEIIVYCGVSKKIIRYDFDGNFIAEFQVGSEYQEYTSMAFYNGNYILFNNYSRYQSKHFLNIFNKKGEVVKRVFEIPYEKREGSLMDIEKKFSYNSNTFSFMTGGSHSVYSLNDDLNCTVKYKINFGEYSLPEGKILYTQNDYSKDNIKYFSPFIRKYFESDDYIVMMYIQNEKHKQIFYNKNNSRFKNTKIEMSSDLDGLRKIPMAMIGNRLIFTNSAIELEKKYDSYGKSTVKLSEEQIRDITENDKVFFSLVRIKM